MKILQPGEFNEQVSLQDPDGTTRDAFNAEVINWATVATVWAKVTAGQGATQIIADRPVMVVPYTVEVRDGITIDLTQRWLWRGKALAIETVVPKYTEGTILTRCLEAAING